MANKFLQGGQLGQAQLRQADTTRELGFDPTADAKAEQASKQVDFLVNSAKAITGGVLKYNENVNAKHKLQAADQRSSYIDYIKQKTARIENIDTLTTAEMEGKLEEFNSDFLETYKDQSYAKHLNNDVSLMKTKVLTGMASRRDSVYSEKVAASTASATSKLTQSYANGDIDDSSYGEQLADIYLTSQMASQVMSSSELDLQPDQRDQYLGLTGKQAQQSMMQGVMVQAANAPDGKLAKTLSHPNFKKSIGVPDVSPEWDKVIMVAQKSGKKSMQAVYDTGVEGLYSKGYQSANSGLPVDIDREVELFRAQGKKLTPEDEYKFRNKFKKQNVDNMIKYDLIRDLEAGKKNTLSHLTEKEQNKAFAAQEAEGLGIEPTDDKPITESLTIDAMNLKMEDDPKNMAGIKKYYGLGGEVSKHVKELIDIPVGGSPDKFENANRFINNMTIAFGDSGRTVESEFGATEVGKVRALNNIHSDPSLSVEEKRIRIDLLKDQFTKINSRGFIKSIANSTINTEDIDKIATDEGWTSMGDLIGARQNSELIMHYANLYEAQGKSGKEAVKAAEEQFNANHFQEELPDGNEIMIPIEHKILNKQGMVMFAKGNPDIVSRIEKDNFVAFGETRSDRSIGMMKASDFNVSKKYIMTYDGQPVRDGGFTYEEYTSYISQLSPEKQREVDSERKMTRQESLEEARLKRAKLKEERRGISTEQQNDIAMRNFRFK